MNKQGSALIMVIIFTGIFSMAALSTLRNAAYLLDAAVDRAAYTQIFIATQGLINIGIELAIENYETLTQDSNEFVIHVPVGDCFGLKKTYAGTIMIKKRKEGLGLRATLDLNASKKCDLRCVVVREIPKRYVVQEWTIATD